MSNWFSRLLQQRTPPPVLDTGLRETLAHWQTAPLPDLERSHTETRYVVLNTHATGLDADTDRLLSVAGVAVDCGRIDLARSYYAELDIEPERILAGLLGYAGSGPVVVFNAAFNRSLLERNIDRHLGVSPGWTWIDLHLLLPRVFPELCDQPTRLAHWMELLGIDTFARFHALGDAWAIARLLQAFLSRALERELISPRALVDLEREMRQFSRR